MATLQTVRHKAGLTQERVAAGMGVVPARVAAIERAGVFRIKPSTLTAYLKACGVDELRVTVIVGDTEIVLCDTYR